MLTFDEFKRYYPIAAQEVMGRTDEGRSLTRLYNYYCSIKQNPDVARDYVSRFVRTLERMDALFNKRALSIGWPSYLT